jgi:diaminobutyrate-2-oxoglutarate transaminase
VETFERLESGVRSYCRSWPAVFTTAKGSTLVDEEGSQYLDFFSGAGALNYGHNPEPLIDALVGYLRRDGVLHGLDMATEAKREFLETFSEVVLEPRGLDYKVQFPGPTGTNAVEAALKLARKVTGRDTVISFTNAFHGMTLGSLSVTGNSMKRDGAGVPLNNAVAMPYEGFLDDQTGVDSIAMLEAFIDGGGSGVDVPAAVIVETVQAEGGINVASEQWLRDLAALCRRHDILLIVDDIQMGCGRTGGFFSFEEAGIAPDIVCLSKSISGSGLPMALVLFRPELDVWLPGEHNGTFRGNNAAFVTATAALRTWWADGSLSESVRQRGAMIRARLEHLVERPPGVFDDARGRGFVQGLHCVLPETADKVTAAAFERGLVIETAGPDGEVVKLLPALTMSDDELARGLELLEVAVEAVVDTAGAELVDTGEKVGS